MQIPDLNSSTEFYDPSPEMKYLLGRAIFSSAGASVGIDNPKIAAATETAIGGHGSYGAVAYPPPEEGTIVIVHPRLDWKNAVRTNANSVCLGRYVTEQGSTAMSQNVRTAPATTTGLMVTFGESEVRRRITKKSVSASNSPRFAHIVSNWARRLNRVQEFRWYIENVAARGLISQRTGRETLLLWESLSSATSSAICVPNAAPGNDGQLLLAWDSGQHHLEIEFESGATPSLFYSDRTAASSSWETDFRHDAPLSQAVLRALALFSEPTNV